jgi:predicted small metal-binding protein
MTRKMIDCRSVSSENNCTLTIAGTEEEVLDAAVAHAISAHGHADSLELREMLCGGAHRCGASPRISRWRGHDRRFPLPSHRGSQRRDGVEVGVVRR